MARLWYHWQRWTSQFEGTTSQLLFLSKEWVSHTQFTEQQLHFDIYLQRLISHLTVIVTWIGQRSTSAVNQVKYKSCFVYQLEPRTESRQIDATDHVHLTGDDRCLTSEDDQEEKWMIDLLGLESALCEHIPQRSDNQVR